LLRSIDRQELPQKDRAGLARPVHTVGVGAGSIRSRSDLSGGQRPGPFLLTQGRHGPLQGPQVDMDPSGGQFGMVQLWVTAIPDVAIHWSSGFSDSTDLLDAEFRRRDTIECLKRQDGRKFTSMIHPGTAIIERCLICRDSQMTVLLNP